MQVINLLKENDMKFTRNGMKEYLEYRIESHLDTIHICETNMTKSNREERKRSLAACRELQAMHEEFFGYKYDPSRE